MSKQFLGFGSSDKFIEAIDRERAVNMFIGSVGKPMAKYPFTTMNSFVCISQTQENEVLYFYHVFHVYKVWSLDHEIMDIDKDKPARLGREVRELTVAWLNKNGITFRETLISFPTSLGLLDGSCTFLKFDNETESFVAR